MAQALSHVTALFTKPTTCFMKPCATLCKPQIAKLAWDLPVLIDPEIPGARFLIFANKDFQNNNNNNNNIKVFGALYKLNALTI